MKRFYLIHQASWLSEVSFQFEPGILGDSFEGKGCVWLDLPDGFRIVSGDFKSEDREDAWNGHPQTVHLHHPVKEKHLPLRLLLTPAHAHKRFFAAHMNLLHHIGVNEDDTMESLNLKVHTIHPGCTIYPVPRASTRWLY